MRKGKPNIKGLLMLEMLNSTHFLSRKGVVKGGVREGGGGGHQAYIDIYVYILNDLSDLCFKMSSFWVPWGSNPQNCGFTHSKSVAQLPVRAIAELHC